MGQGRRVRSLIRCILLIVSAIQGITPDARDLASPVAITMIGPSLIGRPIPVDDEHSPGNPCEAIQESRLWQAHPQENEAGTGYARLAGRATHHISRSVETGLSIVGEKPLTEELSLKLCRLVC
jgi:hypothetical protein